MLGKQEQNFYSLRAAVKGNMTRSYKRNFFIPAVALRDIKSCRNFITLTSLMQFLQQYKDLYVNIFKIMKIKFYLVFFVSETLYNI